MTLLAPLGLLGLISVLVLILIYIIKPNFQQKFISSTFVWKLSLNYRKKKIPISKLRNILLIICQILILVSCALILARPNQILKAQVEEVEVVLIVDSSASMRASNGEEIRFERAVDKAIEQAEKTWSQGGVVTVIVADSQPYYLFGTGVSAERADDLLMAMEDLLDGFTTCSYGEGNVEEALSYCVDIVDRNPDVQIYLYTDNTYANQQEVEAEGLHVVNVAEKGEWNVGILGVEAILSNSGYYHFEVEIGSYGAACNVNVTLEIDGVNAADNTEDGGSLDFTEQFYCEIDTAKKLIFINRDIYDEWVADDKFAEDEIGVPIAPGDEVHSYKKIQVMLEESVDADDYNISIQDSFPTDNNFSLYGGLKEVLRVQYASASPNNFFNGMLYTLKKNYSSLYDIKIKEVNSQSHSADVDTEGHDWYIFEHIMPSKMPTDGIVFLVNPATTPPTGAGFTIEGIRDISSSTNVLALTDEEEHPITKYMTADHIEVTQYYGCKLNDAGYQVLMSCENHPMLAVKDIQKTPNTPASKVILMAFSVHYSNIVLTEEFPIMIMNIFDYFFPSTLPGTSFDVDQSVTINCRGAELTVIGESGEEKITEFPSQLSLRIPGTYTFDQYTDFDKFIEDKCYVKIPKIESNIWLKGEALKNPFKQDKTTEFYKDLLLYFAIALVAFLFIEWWLKGRDNA